MATTTLAPETTAEMAASWCVYSWLMPRERSASAKPGAKSAGNGVREALRSGKPVGLLPDLGGRVRTRPAQLLGQLVELPVGPERIATRARCPVLFGTLRPRPSQGPLPRFQLHLLRLDEPAPPSLAETICSALTREIAQCPGQWLWMAPRFR